jgi:hypothetical protein
MITPTVTRSDQRITLVIRGLFLFKALVWVVFGIVHLTLFRTHLAPILAALLFIDAIVFFWLYRVIIKRNSLILKFAVAFLIANIVLTITDQFGIYDLLVLIVDAVLLALLIQYRRLFLHVKTAR